jgi:uncharacterized protein YegP (UPF0339 family)
MRCYEGGREASGKKGIEAVQKNAADARVVDPTK